MTIVMFIKALKNTIVGKKNLVDEIKKQFKLKKIEVSVKFLKRLAIAYYYMKTRGLKPKQVALQFKIAQRKAALKDLRDLKEVPKTPEGKKLYEAIQLVKEALKKAGKRLNIPIYAAKFEVFNAYFDPVDKVVVILVDKKYFPKLTAREIAAIILHEIGHANELESIYAATILGVAIIDMTLSLLTVLLLPFFLKRDMISTHSYELMELLALTQLSMALESFGRHAEMAADAFATALGFGTELASALEKLHPKNLDPDVEILYAADAHDIPKRRIKAIRELVQDLAKQEKGVIRIK
jgi:Zn-dependent protease with chaperone function